MRHQLHIPAPAQRRRQSHETATSSTTSSIRTSQQPQQKVHRHGILGKMLIVFVTTCIVVQFQVVQFDTSLIYVHATNLRNNYGDHSSLSLSSLSLAESLLLLPRRRRKRNRRWRCSDTGGEDRNRVNLLAVLNHLPRGGATPSTSTTSTATTTGKKKQPSTSTSSPTATDDTKKKKKKRRGKQTAGDVPSGDVLTSKKTQQVVNQKLKEKDAAQALGDAIRDRAHILRYGTSHNSHDDDVSLGAASSNRAIRTMESVGYALGASDYLSTTTTTATAFDGGGGDRDDAATVAEELTAPAAVIVQYFLKSHGGAHALQCLCSLCATLAGVAACCVSSTGGGGGGGGGGDSSSVTNASHHLQLILIQRCMMFAMCKHVAGLMTAAYAAAMTIPTTGFQQAVAWIQILSQDPVSQYVFYAASVLLWLPAATTRSSPHQRQQQLQTPIPSVWWQAYHWVPLLLVGPVVIREFISMALVISDVLVLIVATTTTTTTTSNGDTSRNMNHTLHRVLMMAQAVVDAGMSIVVTPSVWRSSTAVQRQAILAKLTSKISLAMEVAVGLLMTIDVMIRIVTMLFFNTGPIQIRPFIKAWVCTQLYVQFLWTRRTKITKLAATVRGGAAMVPIYVLNVLLDPTTSMGLSSTPDTSRTSNIRVSQSLQQLESTTTGPPEEDDARHRWTWRDYVRLAFDIDDSKC
jgi:hypothetical protein